MRIFRKTHHTRFEKAIFLLMALVLFNVFLPTIGFSQPQTSKVTIDGLRTPASPGFVLLGVEPSSVERPTTPKVLAVSLISGTKDTDFFQRNYALEVAPYWLFSHPNLTFDDYYNAGIGQSLLQNLSISIATSELTSTATETGTNATESMTTGTGIGLGMRTLLVAGRANPELKNKSSELLEQQIIVLNTDNKEERAKLQEITLQIQSLDKKRVGWLLELAGAIVVNFPEDTFDKREVARWGVWITPTYRLKAPLLDFIAVGRYIRDSEKTEGKKALYDLGGRLLWQPNKQLSLSTEFVRRFNATPQDKDTNRVSVNLEYLLSEGLYLTTSFGKNFNQTDEEEEKGTLIALFGINFGLGQKPSLILGESN